MQHDHVRDDSGLFEGIQPSTSQVNLTQEHVQDRPSIESVPAGSSSNGHRVPVPAYDDAGNDQRGEGATPATATGAGAAGAATGEKGGAGVAPVIEGTPFYKQRWFIISQLITALIAIGLLFVILYPVIHAIAQHIVGASVINIDTVAINSPTNESFSLGINGYVTHAGIFGASIEFPEPMDIYWRQENGTEVQIGRTSFTPLKARKARAYINQTNHFDVTHQTAFGEFTQYMITSPNFTWVLRTANLAVRAGLLPQSTGINFEKTLTLPGIDNFNNHITLDDFQLPRDAPDGAGIEYSARTTLFNPSPFELGLGTVVFNLTYKGVYLGLGTQKDTKIVPGNNSVTLTGILVPHNDSASDLATMSELFTQYLNSEKSDVVASGLSTLQDDGTIISWLSLGLSALHIHVPFVPPTPIDPIKAISIGDFDLAFTKDTAWAPKANTKTVQASLALPFGFNLEIGEIMNTFNISKNASVAGGLSTPLGASTSNVVVYGPTNTSGTIDIQIVDTPLYVGTESHSTFSLFTTDLTNVYHEDFQLVGRSHAVANLSIGQLVLDPINFNVTSGLYGLQGLQGLVAIGTPDVVGGTTDGINLNINVTITNPSNLNLAVGDLQTQLQRGDGLLGTVTMPNLTLNVGNNSVAATSIFQPNNSPEGKDTLNKFVGGTDVTIHIAGYDQSTQVESLLEAFESLSLNVTLPALTTKLLDSASLQVLNSTGHSDNITHVTVALANPFTAGLQISQVTSNVSYEGLTLGHINTGTNFSASGKASTTSPDLNLDLNLDPQTLFTVTRSLAVKAGLDTEQLDGIVQLGGYHYLDTTSQKREVVEAQIAARSLEKRDNIYTGFDLPTFVDGAFKKLTSDVELTSTVTIGQYTTELTYSQPGVNTTTDESLNLLLPILAQPIVQKIVDGSGLGIENVLITDPKATSFTTQLAGSVTNAGPFDAIISFPNGLNIAWNNGTLGSIKMPDINITGDVGSNFQVTTDFSIADVNHLTDFTKVLLTTETFDWEISGSNLSVSAIGITVPGINFPSKKVTLKGMNGLKNDVVIDNFDLPENDPAGGIHLTLNTTITNPSQVGVQLESISFQSFYQSTNLGPVAANSTFTLAPSATVNLSMAGRLIPQTEDSALADVSTVFNNFIHGQDSNITVQGDSAGPAEATWLNEGIKALLISTLLPNQGKLDIIKTIVLDDLDLRFTEATGWDPSTSTTESDISFTIPFGFPIDITALESNISVGDGGASFAQLTVPMVPSTTEVDARIIHFAFSSVPLAAFDDQHSAFQQFLASTAVSANQSMSLSGSANSQAGTAVGTLSLRDIEFSVGTSIAGLQGLNTKPVQLVSQLDVAHGYPDFLLITVNASLFNPSNITLGAGDVAFGLVFNDAEIGTADISNIVVIPGNGTYAVQIHYAPEGSAVPTGQLLLANYLQGVDSDTTIQGSQSSTDIDSLKVALSEITLTPVTVPALHQNLITSASLVFPVDIVQTGIAEATFDLSNPFTAAINLLKVSTGATYQNLTLGAIENVDESSNPIHADGHSNITSPQLPFHFNLDPVTIIELLLSGASNNGVDLGPLPDLFKLALANPDYGSQINSSVLTTNSTCNSGKQFDVDDAILDSLKNLEVTLNISTSVKLDDFPTDLAFSQYNVSAITDNTALYLIGAVAPPIVQTLVDGANLTFNSANISNIADDGFSLALEGALTNIGPLDALISFPKPVTVVWQGASIAEIAIPDICAAAESGVPDLITSGQLTITDQDGFTTFSSFLLHNEAFTWTIETDALRVTALGTVFDNVKLSKDITLKAFNNLPGVTIADFDLVSGDSSGIEFSTNASIPSPAQLGITLGTVGFEGFFQSLDIGPITGKGLTLAPESTTTEALAGIITPKTSSSDLQTLDVLFSNYLTGLNQTLKVDGSFVAPDGSDEVAWLSAAFKTLELDVTLPALHQNIIGSASLVFPIDIVQTGIAQASFVLDNPFTASINLLEVSAGATYADSLFLGAIEHVDLSSNPVHAPGHQNTSSSELPFHFNLDPTTIITLLLDGAANNNVDLGPLPDLFKIALANPDYGSQINSSVLTTNSSCNSGKQFDVDDAILDSLKNLEVTLNISSEVAIDSSFTFDLDFNQYNVTAITDSTALYLIGAVAPPIVQTLVDGANLTFNSANISNITNDGFGLNLGGALTNIGPLDALISFPEPVTVVWQGSSIAKIAIPDICAAANDGVPSLITSGQLTITDQDGFTEFSTFLLHNEEFTWTIETDALRVTALGTIFDNVKLSKDISLKAFDNLPGVTIADFDLVSGDSAGIEFATNASIPSPAQLGIQLGTVGFEAFFQSLDIGPIKGDNLFLAPESTTSEALAGTITPKTSGSDLQMLDTLFSNYLTGLNQTLIVDGSFVAPDGSDEVAWLSAAFKTLELNVTLPALHQNIIDSASLVFPTDIVQTGIATSTFVLDNPFTASINLLKVSAGATYADSLFLGAIEDVDLSSNPIHAPGHQNTTSSELPFHFNLDPTTIITLLLDGAANNNVDLGPLPDLFKIALANPDYGSQINTSVTGNDSCSSGHQFDVDDAILNSLKNLQVTLNISSEVAIDSSFAFDLDFKQYNVTAVTDKTALYLIGAVAPPIVQTLVDGANLTFNAANISDITNDGFALALNGAITNIGPLDALISFPEPVTVSWQNRDIATISLPDICAAADTGVPDLVTSGHLTITDQDGFTDFTTYLLHNEDFTWTITTDALRVTALGTAFDNVKLSKDVTLKAFNNIPGVTISNFDLPGDAEEGGIEISTDSMIPSQSQISIGLGTVGFEAYFDGVDIGPLTGTNLYLAAMSTTTEHLTGRITPKSSSSDLDTLGVLFSNFLAGQNQTLNVKGVSVAPDGNDEIGWLSTAFKTLEINVTLPGHIYQIIDSISLNDFQLTMTEEGQAFAPLAGSTDTVAEYKNPFGFSLQVIQSSENITLAESGVDIATLQLPLEDNVGGVSTGNLAPLQISFSNQTLQSVNDGAFSSFIKAVTDTSGVTFELKGTANVVAKTTVGNIPISGIPFNTSTSLAGINGFGGTASLSNVTVTGSGGDGGDQYVLAKLTTTLNNPSNISLDTVDVSFPVIYKGDTLGRAVIPTLHLVPGENHISAEFHYMPADANDTVAEGFLSSFVQGSDDLPLTIKGDSDSSSFASLVPGLEGISLDANLPAMNSPPILTHVNVFITLDTLVDNLVEVNFDVFNPLDAPLHISLSQADSGVNGKTYAIFTQPFSGFTVPPHETANSGTFKNVLLVNGAIPSLAIIPLGYLDIQSASTVTVGDGGYTIPWFHINQDHVTTVYSIDILGISASNTGALSGLASSISASLNGELTTAVSAASSIIGNVTSDVGGITSAVGSVASSVAGDITSDVGKVTSAVGAATSAAGSAASRITSAAVAGASSAVAAATSEGGKVTSVAGAAAGAATSAAGAALSGIVHGGNEGATSAAAATTTAAAAAKSAAASSA
ncbi:hypothetical protein PENSPDRAFT_747787 [Peniophora sp. CONT]|nr:hypothetical protein PENSPDRAFT_747787 [Peniophora sp. CONT]